MEHGIGQWMEGPVSSDEERDKETRDSTTGESFKPERAEACIV